MKKIFFILLSILIFQDLLQAQAYEGNIEYDKKRQEAFVIEYPYTPEAVENAIVARMQKLGYKGKEEKGMFNKDKGFRKFRDAFITEVDSKSHDYIIKVEPKSRKDSDRSLIYLIVMDGDINYKGEMDALGVTGAKDFLNSLLPDIEASQLELDIIGQEDAVEKAEKKLDNLKSEKKNMEEKIRKLQDDIKDNEKAQEDASEVIKNQKKVLENLRERRKS